MLYLILQSISTATYSTIAGFLKIEKTLINFMLTCFLSALKFICHPIIILPIICAAIYCAIVLLPQSSSAVASNRMLVGSRNNRDITANRMKRLMDKDVEQHKEEPQ